MDIEQLKNLLRHYHLKPNFTYGQNFLVDDIVLQDIVDAAEITSSDAILEIGPGIGNLTRLLCERAGFVLSVEKDPKFFPVLKSIKKDFRKNFRFEIADVLEFDFQRVLCSRSGYTDTNPDQRITTDNDHPHLSANPDTIRKSGSVYKIVANIPYFITGKILQLFLQAKIKPASITILVQKEVAESITARPGKLSVLAISVQLYGEPKIIRIVSRESFHPIPKVDSALVRIAPYDKIPYGILDEKKFFAVLRACFAGKRKQIHNTLKNNLGLAPDRVAQILSSLKINPAARPQELTIEQWIELSDKITASS